jgi:NADP-dependent 3-hydroxy acid dehydrogenase YdfG
MVALIARTAAQIEAVAEAINTDGVTARAYPANIVDHVAVDKSFVTIERDLGAVSLLTNNDDRLSAYGPIWTVDPDEWRRDVETNIFGTFNCCRVVPPAMITRRRGRVIVMTAAGRRPRPRTARAIRPAKRGCSVSLNASPTRSRARACSCSR